MRLTDYLHSAGISASEFGRRLSVRLNRRVPPQSVHRWTVPQDHSNYAVPRARTIAAIVAETGGAVQPNDWFPAGVRPLRRPRSPEINIAAARKAAAVRRRQREARP